MLELGSGARRAIGALLETAGVRPLAMLPAVLVGKRRLGAAAAARAMCLAVIKPTGQIFSSHCHCLVCCWALSH